MPDRIIRDRLDVLAAGIDRGVRRLRCGCAGRLVKVYDGGSIPSTVPAIFLTHPVALGGTEDEGDVPTQTDDTSEVIPVYVIGPEAPAAGDLLTAHAAGGRWVAWKGLSAPPEFCVAQCSPSNIPKGTLTATWTSGTGPSPAPAGSRPMIYYPYGAGSGSIFSGRPSWATGAPTGTPAIGTKGTSVSLTCYNGQITAALTGYTYTGGGWVAYCDGIILSYLLGFDATCGRTIGLDLSLASSSSNPFDLEWTVVNGPYNANATKYYGSLSITADAGFTPEARICCGPCPLPKADLTLTNGATVTTLAFDPDAGTWSDGSYTLECGDSLFVSLAGPGGPWVTAGSGQSCDPLHLVFTDGTNSIYIDE